MLFRTIYYSLSTAVCSFVFFFLFHCHIVLTGKQNIIIYFLLYRIRGQNKLSQHSNLLYCLKKLLVKKSKPYLVDSIPKLNKQIPFFLNVLFQFSLLSWMFIYYNVIQLSLCSMFSLFVDKELVRNQISMVCLMIYVQQSTKM